MWVILAIFVSLLAVIAAGVLQYKNAIETRERTERLLKQQQEQQRKELEEQQRIQDERKKREEEDRRKEEAIRKRQEDKQKKRQEREALEALNKKREEEDAKRREEQKKRELEEKRQAELEWKAEGAKYLKEQEDLKKWRADQDRIARAKENERLRAEKVREERLKAEAEEQRLADESKKREQEEKLTCGTLYQPIPEAALKKHLSALRNACELRCPKALKSPVAPDRNPFATFTPEHFPATLELLLCTNNLDVEKSAKGVLASAELLLDMEVFKTRDNWIGLLENIPAEHVIAAIERINFADRRPAAKDEKKAYIPSYPDLLTIIEQYCRKTGCMGIDLARDISALLNGKHCQNRCAVFVFICMFGAEAKRCNRWFFINVMLLDLIAAGCIEWPSVFGTRKGGALGLYPPSTISAVHNSREPDTMTDTIKEERDVISMWLRQCLRIGSDQPLEIKYDKCCELLFRRLKSTELLNLREV